MATRPRSTIDFKYTYVHHIPRVSKPFLEWLKLPMEFHVYTSPWVEDAGKVVCSDDPKIQRRISGTVNEKAAKAFEKRQAEAAAKAAKAASKASSKRRSKSDKHHDKSEDRANKYKKECKKLQKKVKELEAKLAAAKGGQPSGKKRSAIEEV
mgnify:FL=1